VKRISLSVIKRRSREMSSGLPVTRQRHFGGLVLASHSDCACREVKSSLPPRLWPIDEAVILPVFDRAETAALRTLISSLEAFRSTDDAGCISPVEIALDDERPGQRPKDRQTISRAVARPAAVRPRFARIFLRGLSRAHS
jgi:hypothetical protein